MTQEAKRESSGGISYEVILKKAAANGVPTPNSPLRVNRDLTNETIEQKLKKAEERRQSFEALRLESVRKDRSRAEIVASKVQENEDSFTKLTREKIRRSMEMNKANRETQIKALQERLREHLKHVQMVCQNSDKLNEEFTKECDGKLQEKLQAYEMNRHKQMQTVIDRLKEHAKHIEEVCLTNKESTMSKQQEEKIFEKLQAAYDKRMEQFNALKEKLQEHEKRIEEVRKNKSRQQSGDGDAPGEMIEASNS